MKPELSATDECTLTAVVVLGCLR